VSVVVILLMFLAVVLMVNNVDDTSEPQLFRPASDSRSEESPDRAVPN
jgi:hypothetical protein